MKEARFLIERYVERGLTGAQIFKLLKPHGIGRRFINRTIQRLRETGSVGDRQRSGRPRTVRTKERVKRVREKIRRNPERSQRKLAVEEKVSRSSIQRILKNDLMLRPYKKRVLHELSDEQK